MSAFQKETVLSVKHWTDSLFSFTATRDPGFRFQNGQFAMIGLEVEGRPLLRAYSMASANHEDALEFFSIKVADEPLNLTPAENQGRRHDSGWPQGHGNADRGQPHSRQAAAVALDRHRAGAVCQPDQGSRYL
jgi:predicted ferric reductase